MCVFFYLLRGGKIEKIAFEVRINKYSVLLRKSVLRNYVIIQIAIIIIYQERGGFPVYVIL